MAIVRNIKSNILYEYLGGNQFVNLCTGVAGFVSDEAAQKTFVINLEATQIINDYPTVKDLICRVHLKMDK